MKCGTHSHHQFQRPGNGGEGRGRGPRVQRRRLGAFDVVEVEFGDQREVEANLFAAAGQPADVVPGDRHVFFFDVAQPAAEDGEPVSVSHYAASFSRKSTSFSNGLKPITRGPSATKFERALMS